MSRDDCVFWTTSAMHSSSNPPAILVRRRHPVRSDQGQVFRPKEGHSFRFKPATRAGCTAGSGDYFLDLRPALIEVVPLISIRSAPVTRRSAPCVTRVS